MDLMDEWRSPQPSLQDMRLGFSRISSQSGIYRLTILCLTRGIGANVVVLS
jgi:hypothetical protein